MQNVTEPPLLSPKGTFPATVVKVIDHYKLAINRGKHNVIRQGQRMMVYYIDDEEILDPNTGESLGYLELVKGTGRVIFVQDKISIIESDKMIDKLGKRLPFENPQVGDLVKPI
jgi:hypothetical protein